MNLENLANMNKSFQEVLPQNVVDAVQLVLLNHTIVENMKPHNDALEAKSLAQVKPVIVPFVHEGRAHTELDDRVGEQITSFFDLYMASDAQAGACYEIVRKGMATLGFEAPEGISVFARAEHALCKAKQLLVDSLEPFTGLSNRDFSYQLDKRDQYVDLSVRYLIKIADAQGIDFKLPG